MRTIRKLHVIGSTGLSRIDNVPPPAAFGQSRLPALTDAHGRQYRYLRVSVTDRCSMACVYCMPERGERDHALRREVLSFEQTTRLARIFAAMGVTRMRLTGGEPLLRRELPRLVRSLREEAAVQDLWLTTNGLRLPALARALADAGLHGVNVSLDTLQTRSFSTITRGSKLADVIAGIDAARAAGLTVKLNVVAMRGVNDAEFSDIVRWAWERDITPRFIELMPLGEGSKLMIAHHLPTQRIREHIGHLVADRVLPRDPASGPACYYPAADGTGRKVGIIGAISDNFCNDCNRVRLTSRGEIIACIASRAHVPLKQLIEAGADDRALAWAMHRALNSKLAGHAFRLNATEAHGRGMSLVGG